MKKYTVQMTQAAINDLETIYTYISNVLLSVDTAKQQCSRILEKINSLETFPKRNRELYLKEIFPIIKSKLIIMLLFIQFRMIQLQYFVSCTVLPIYWNAWRNMDNCLE